MAADRWIAIAGTVGNFRTDTRVFNPSVTKDIEVTARFLPQGAANNNERVAAPGVTFTVPKRQMKVLDDVVTALFSTTGIGGIFLTSADDFLATSRIYAQTATGTLGQFSDALGPGVALTRGVLLQLKSIPSFRTNIGLASPVNASTNIVWRLYDKNNTLVETKPMTVPPYAVVAPTNIVTLIGGASADLSDAWLSFTSDNPIFAYASVIDNATTDPTFIAAQADTGTEPVVDPPAIKVFDVTLSSFEIDIAPAVVLKKGEQAKFRVRSANMTHGFQLVSPSGVTVIPSMIYLPGTPTQEYTVTFSEAGTYSYFCTNANCGEGHEGMIGDFPVTN